MHASSTTASEELPRRCWASVDAAALRSNLAVAAKHSPDAQLIPVIKSNAYGHGVFPVADALLLSDLPISHLAVATFGEAVALYDHLAEREQPPKILLLSGFANTQELEVLEERGIEAIVHTPQQVQTLLAYCEAQGQSFLSRLWLKIDTGMHRLGFDSAGFKEALDSLGSRLGIEQLVVMSHFASADDRVGELALLQTRGQIALFDRSFAACDGKAQRISGSFSSSAAILTLPQAHRDYVRPGIMLYGSSPLAGRSAAELGLLPAMTLHARISSIKTVAAGEYIGYGAAYRCARAMRIGVVAIGYGDGYPRSAVNGTPVLVKFPGGSRRTQLVGRVSMDMITIDLSGIDEAELGSEVILWGEGLPADEVAIASGTIAYELFCKTTARVPFDYEN